MASIKAYKKNGITFYEAAVYLGKEELTGRDRYTHKRGFTGKKEATLWASRQTLDAQRVDLTKKRNTHFKAIYLEWYESYKNTVRESTYAHTTDMFDNHILPYFGPKRINDITTAMLQKAVNQWSTEATRNYKRWYRFTVRVLKYAIKQGYIMRNPATGVVIPKVQPDPGDVPENFWSRDELASFFSYIDPHQEPEKYTLFRVLAFAGLRRGECLALTWADVSFSDSSIRINKTLTQGEKGRQIVQAPKTRMGRRTVPIDSKTVASLKQWRVTQLRLYMAHGINTNSPEQLVFATSRNGHKYLNQPEKWLKAIEDLDEKSDHPKLPHRITVHGFRHSHASALFAAGATIKEVQMRLGHENAQTTLNVYTHVTADQSEEAAKRVANYLNF